MAAASQLACRAGPTIYITLAFHRSPLTQRCLGPRPGGPEVPGATRGLRQPVKAQPCLGSPGTGEGQDSSLLWAQGLRSPPCQPLMEEEGGLWGPAASKERGLSSQRGSPRTKYKQNFQGEPATATTAGTLSCAWYHRAGEPWQHKCLFAPRCPEHILCPKTAIQVSPDQVQLESQSELSLLRPSFPPCSSGQHGSNSWSLSSQPFLDAQHDQTQPRAHCSRPEPTSRGEDAGWGGGASLTS